MDKPAPETDTGLIQLLKLGDKSAANELISRYFSRVVKAADRRIGQCRVPVTCGDDIAASVFESLWERARENRLSEEELKDSVELWKLLCKMVAYKTTDHLRRESAQKRGGRVPHGGGTSAGNENRRAIDVNQLPADEWSTTELAVFREEHLRLLALLDSDTMAQIAMMRLEGFTVAEIGDEFQKSLRWVGRKLALIRNIWQSEYDSICSR